MEKATIFLGWKNIPILCSILICLKERKLLLTSILVSTPKYKSLNSLNYTELQNRVDVCYHDPRLQHPDKATL